MKKHVFIVAVAIAVGMPTFAQDGTKKTSHVVQKQVTYNSQAEKDKAVQEKEQRLKVNTNDPTYPKDLLEKEKQELNAAKKAKVKH